MYISMSHVFRAIPWLIFLFKKPPTRRAFFVFCDVNFNTRRPTAPPGVYSMDLSGWKPMDDEWMANANGWYMAIYTKRGLNHIYKSPFQLLQIYYELDDLVIIHQVPIWNVNFMGILLIQKQLKECATEYCTSMRWKKLLYHCINFIWK